MLDIAIDALAGAIFFILGHFVAKAIVDPIAKRNAYIMILVAIGVGGTTLTRDALTPMLRAQNADAQIAVLLEQDTVLRTILDDHPELEPPFRAAMVDAIKTGDRAAASAAGHAILGSVFPQYVAKATDESVYAFAQQLVTTLEAIRADDPKRCFQYLFPQVAGGTALQEGEGRSAVYAAMEGVVTSSGAGPAPESAEAIQEVLDGVVSSLQATYGEDLWMLSGPADPDVDQSAVCAMTIDLYAGALALPAPDSHRLLRYLFAP